MIYWVTVGNETYNQVKTSVSVCFYKVTLTEGARESDCVSASETVMASVLRLSLKYFSALICSVFSASEDGWMPRDTCACTHMQRQLRSLTASSPSMPEERREERRSWEKLEGKKNRNIKIKKEKVHNCICLI